MDKNRVEVREGRVSEGRVSEGRVSESRVSVVQRLRGQLQSHGFQRRRGGLVEWLVEGEGSGGGILAWWLAWRACGQHRILVVADREGRFYPPAAAAWGCDLDRVIVLRPRDPQDEAWGIDQALRCSAVGAVWSWQERLSERTFRRWQLAAEAGGNWGVLVRPAHVRGQPSWSDWQWLVQAIPSSCTAPCYDALKSRAPSALGRVRVETLRARGTEAWWQEAQESQELKEEIDAAGQAPWRHAAVRNLVRNAVGDAVELDLGTWIVDAREPTPATTGSTDT